MTYRMKRWLSRYLPAEVTGTLTALLCAWGALLVTGSSAAGAVGGTWGENLAYYGTMLARELGARTIRAFPVVARDLVVEFGPATALDSLLVRPALLYYGLLWAPNPSLGILGGKLIADLSFYAPVIVSYELQRACKSRAREQLSK